jgi:three-Cys-motif partner protein
MDQRNDAPVVSLEQGHAEQLEYLKHVSRIKHSILRGYLGAWSAILGKGFDDLAVYDCFAGPGAYKDEFDRELPGSPAHVLEIANDFVSKSAFRSIRLGFTEQNQLKAARLRARLRLVEVSPQVSWNVLSADASDFVQDIVRGSRRPGRVIPTFFFVDPCGYPLPVPMLREMLAIPKAEILVNLMWFAVRRGLANPLQQTLVDRMFGHPKWRDQEFMKLHGKEQEDGFIAYFRREVGARFHLPFAMSFSPEDNVPGPETRHKYYLLHFANGHVRAPLAMKEVMHSAEGKLNKLRPPEPAKLQMELFKKTESSDPLAPLRSFVFRKFPSGTTATIFEIRAESWQLPYVQSDYIRVLRELEGEFLDIEPASSKKNIDRRVVRFR